MSYSKRKIDVQFQRGSGSFGEGPPLDTVTLSGLRVITNIQKNGQPALNEAWVRIFGMTKSDMSKLSGIAYPTGYPYERHDVMTVYAGDDVSGMSLAFSGILQYGYEDLQAAPEVSFVAHGLSGAVAKLKPSQVRSYPGDADVAKVMDGLATEMGYKLVNCGVTGTFPTPYLHGTFLDQVNQLAEIANIWAVPEDEQYLVICPKNGSRSPPVVKGPAPSLAVIPLVSSATGMVGYPKAMNPGWIGMRMLYNHNILFLGNIKVESSIEQMSGTWRVNTINHLLDSEMPNGSWFTDVTATIFQPNG